METISNTKLNINAQSKMTKNKIVLSKEESVNLFFIPTDNNYFDNNIKASIKPILSLSLVTN